MEMTATPYWGTSERNPRTAGSVRMAVPFWERVGATDSLQ